MMNLTAASYETPYTSPYSNYGINGTPVSGNLADVTAVGKANDKESTEKAQKNGITEECQTCKNRKYQDGSDEMVSFKAPTVLTPGRAASAVRAHEQEHVGNAYSKAAKNNGKVVSATVSIHTSICPECGRSYVSGGTTSTQIKYYNEENPYQQELKAADKIKYTGMHADYAV